MLIKIIALISLLIYVILLLKDELHIMQLNSYFNSRYCKWLKENYFSRFDKIKIILIFVLLIYCFYSVDIIGIGLIISSSLGSLKLKLVKFKAKKKLDFTTRAMRLFAIQVSVFLLPIITIILLNLDDKYIAWSVLLSIFFTFINILLSNIIVFPLEKTINQWYVNDAKKKIKSHSGCQCFT